MPSFKLSPDPSAAAARPPDALHPHGKTTAGLLHKLGVALTLCASPMPEHQRHKLFKDIGRLRCFAEGVLRAVTIRCTECGTVAQLVSGWHVLALNEFVERRWLSSVHPKRYQSIRPDCGPAWPNEFRQRRLAGKLRIAFDGLSSRTMAPFTGKAEQ